MKLTGDHTQLLFDVPNTFSTPFLPSKQMNILGVTQHILATDQIKQCCLASAIPTKHHPLFAFPDRPIELVENAYRTIPQRDKQALGASKSFSQRDVCSDSYDSPNSYCYINMLPIEFKNPKHKEFKECIGD